MKSPSHPSIGLYLVVVFKPYFHSSPHTPVTFPSHLTAKRGGARPEWNNDNRVKTTSFDDLWEENLGRRDELPQKSETITDARKAWANVGLGVSAVTLW